MDSAQCPAIVVFNHSYNFREPDCYINVSYFTLNKDTFFKGLSMDNIKLNFKEIINFVVDCIYQDQSRIQCENDNELLNSEKMEIS